MRIIAGSAKGHRLKCIEGLNTRPTQDRVKESIFNIIMNYIADSKVLDLFSGTGNLAIEALSRGASYAVMLDTNPKCVNIINENVVHTKFVDNAKAIMMDALAFLKSTNDEFDLIFIDPPYNKGLIIPALNEIFTRKILSKNGLVVVEHDKRDPLVNIQFVIARQQIYGDTTVSFLKYE